MGSTGEVRSRAWICGFSSTAKTAAFAGGARYRPTTSRILSISSGSGEILKSSARHGCSPNARQMRCTLDGEIPTRLASSRLDQCVAPSGTSSSVRTTTSSTWASLMVRGTPGRGSSPSPSSRLARKRVRHFLTVARLMPSRAATAILGPPSAQAKTIRARSASPCAVFRRFAQFSSVRRSASDSTSGSSLVSPMPPADRGPTASSPPSRDLKQNTTHVVMRKPKTGTLAWDIPAGAGTVLPPAPPPAKESAMPPSLRPVPVAEPIFVPAGTTCADAVAAARLPMTGPNAIVVARGPDGALRDLSWAPDADIKIEPVALSSQDGLYVLRHSAAHVLAQSVQDLYPEARLGIGPPIENGFYYDFDVERPFQPEDLQRIESRMTELITSPARSRSGWPRSRSGSSPSSTSCLTTRARCSASSPTRGCAPTSMPPPGGCR